MMKMVMSCFVFLACVFSCVESRGRDFRGRGGKVLSRSLRGAGHGQASSDTAAMPASLLGSRYLAGVYDVVVLPFSGIFHAVKERVSGYDEAHSELSVWVEANKPLLTIADRNDKVKNVVAIFAALEELKTLLVTNFPEVRRMIEDFDKEQEISIRTPVGKRCK